MNPSPSRPTAISPIISRAIAHNPKLQGHGNISASAALARADVRNCRAHFLIDAAWEPVEYVLFFNRLNRTRE
jgi:hypothetical protein